MPAPPGLVGLDGLDFFWAEPDPVAPELPLAPDDPAVPEAEDPPPDAERLLSPQPVIRAPLRANTVAAANAVNFMLTSMGLCARIRSK